MPGLPLSELSAPSYSPGYAPDGVEEEDQSQIVSMTTRRKPKFLQYPPDVPRMTRLGPCTFGVNTGPVADNADLTKLTVPMLKEQLGLRDMPEGGNKKDLIERLRNWKTYKPETVAVREAPDRQVFGPISYNRSVTGITRFWVKPDEKDHISAAKKAMEESMYIIKQQDNHDGSPGLTVGVYSEMGSDNYQVTIGNKTSCNCSSITFRPKSNCKHIIYVLTHILRAPAELLPQRTLFTEELMKLLDHAPKVRFTAAEVSTDPCMSDGVPKSKDGNCCPVCFKDIGEAQTACCGKCGYHTHSSCFDIYARELSGWGVDCAVCQGAWSPAAV
ncbi:SAP domain-containing protein [Colletotrichum graminicola M1.001]|uniref:SAP domain-containing protein n=1 Tax=Colletotrichum graminicola (strain M1.001 / M2 / FGSC 10212) TaxID=645133 RepID=E3Q9T0_COLGM|nr:SAP domain-containing protein [Colletotrichum graminicola M1.001]EFQ27618.1 SAP domain-containing protein [Colletotrichum graminicola M1.001]